jgi:para-aminobenzoate synthetase component 1
MPRVAELEYSDAIARRFRALADLPWPVWLDSSAPGGPSGRYDIFAADPSVTLRTRGESTEIVMRDGRATASPRSPFALLRERLGERCAPVAGLPFCGGAIGYFGYDLGRRLERLPSLAAADVDMPELAIGLYDWAVVVDHERRSARLVGLGRDPRTFEQWPVLLERLARSPAKPAAPFRVLTRARSSFSRAEYAEAFRRVQEHIRVGDCYQVNLTQRFEARADGDPWAAYLKLREINPAPFAAYLDFPDG